MIFQLGRPPFSSQCRAGINCIAPDLPSEALISYHKLALENQWRIIPYIVQLVIGSVPIHLGRINSSPLQTLGTLRPQSASHTLSTTYVLGSKHVSAVHFVL